MDARSIEARLEERGWTAKGAAALVGEQDALDGATLRAVADAASTREHGGHGREASHLAAAALRAPTSPPRLDEEAEALRWAQNRLEGVVRRHATAATIKKLPEAHRRAIEDWASPVDADAIAAVPDEEVEGAVKDMIKGLSEEALVAAFEACARQVVAFAATRPAAACGVARAALEGEEHAHAPHEHLAAALRDWVGPLWAGLLEALASLEDGDGARKGALKWMLATKGGEVRVGRAEVPVDRMVPRDRASVLDTLQKKALKSTTARRALLQAGHMLLDRDDYLALCREHDYAHGIVVTLLEADRVEEAAAEAGKAIAEDDSQWEIAKLFDACGRTDLAIDMLRDVAADTVSSALEHWLAERLDERGEEEEVVALYRNRFSKRPALPQYHALRDRVEEGAWEVLRSELLDELRGRRLHRPLLDIAADERDVDLLASIAPELDEDQAEHAKQMLEAWLDRATAPRPKVEAILARIEKRTSKADVAPKEVLAAEPIPKRVRHKKFGEGEVVGWSGEREQRKLEIAFPDVGTKTLLRRFVEIVE